VGFGLVFAWLQRWAPGVVHRAYQLANNAVTEDRQFMDLYWRLVADRRMILSIREAYNLYYHLKRTAELEGDVAELGVYRGGGAKLLRSCKGASRLHLFDTFGGMPDTAAPIDRHGAGDFADTSEESVQSYLGADDTIRFHAGIFPATSAELPKDIQFRFVHLDVDLYQSTLDGLRYFHPRLVPGGVLISHDFNSISCPGVRAAFEAYFAEVDDCVLPLFDTQCIVVKGGQTGRRLSVASRS
jgi:O-methyltransferase